MSSDPTQAAKDYLNRQGYPFEMKVASLFQKADFGIHQSTYYIDSVTEVPREIDIIAIWHRKIKDRNFNIVFPVECKYAVSPWILFSSITEGFPICYSQNRNGTQWILHLHKQLGWNMIFEVERNLGYGLTVTNRANNFEEKGGSSPKKEKDTSYEAIQTLLSFLKSEKQYHRFAVPRDFVIYVPIIALRGKLVEAKLDKDYNIECREINEGQIYYKEDLFGAIPKIHIVTEDKLEEYIKTLKADCEKLMSDPYVVDSLVPSESVQPSYGRNSPSKYSY